MSSPFIEVRSLHKHFGSVKAVNDVSFSVDKGEVLGFIGTNGAGKSTTMKVITGFLPPTMGTAFVCGHDIRVDPIAAKRRFGYLPEGAPLYGDMTPEGFLDFIGRSRKMTRAARRAAIKNVVERMGLGEVLHRRIETLSKGFRRRVGLAQAILHDPDVLILDEPTDGLDPNQKHDVRELIRSMGDTKAIIISTHILEEVDAVCDRAVIIDHGRVVSDGTPLQLHARSPEFNSVALRVTEQDATRLVEVLGALPEVAKVERRNASNGLVSLLVLPRNGQFIADMVGATVRQNNIFVTDMHAETGKLDDVFRAVTIHSRAT